MKTLQAFARDDYLGPQQPQSPMKEPVMESKRSKEGLVVSEDKYWEKYYHDPDFVYEWNNGRLEVKPVSDVKGSDVYQWLCDIMRCYCRTWPEGKTINLDIGFRLDIPNKPQIRRPDLCVVVRDNPDALNPDDMTYGGTYDMCIESLSHSTPKDIKRDTVVKKKAYEAAGVREYYILDARGMETAFYRLNKKGRYVKIKPASGDIIRSEVLPGFQFRISDLYSQPPLEKLTEDEIYHHYVFPSHKEVKQLLENERLRAEKAEKKLLETARKMTSSGMDTAMIAQFTGISADEIAALKF